MTRALPTHYAMLDVPETATLETILAAYRSQREACRAGRDAVDPAGAHRRLQALDDAYAVLSDPQRRRRHDAWIAYRASARAQASETRGPARRTTAAAPSTGTRTAPAGRTRTAGWGRLGSSLLARLRIAS